MPIHERTNELDPAQFAELVSPYGEPADVPAGDVTELLRRPATDWGQCNALGCGAPPAYAVTVKGETYAYPCCTEHIPAMLTPAAEHIVTRLPQ